MCFQIAGKNRATQNSDDGLVLLDKAGEADKMAFSLEAKPTIFAPLKWALSLTRERRLWVASSRSA